MSDSSKPSSSLDIFAYSELEQFRPVPHMGRMDYTPNTKAIDVEQTVLSLPNFRAYLLKTFPRTLDASAPSGKTSVGFTMDDSTTINFNGWRKNRPAVFIGHDGASYKMAEEVPSTFGLVTFEPAVADRGWPQTPASAAIIVTSAEAESHLRELLLAALEFAIQSPDDLEDATEGLKQSFFLAIDEAILAKDSIETNKISGRNTHFDLMAAIDAYLADHVGKPIYNDDIARHLKVSNRTLHGAVLQYRGMSLHRYLRIRRLWLVRKQLLAGAKSVKACALANGFWHLGDFSRIYQLQFGEAPSQTLRQS